MRVREVLETPPPRGRGPAWVWVRVVELAEGEPVPAGACEVPGDEPLSDWTREE